MRMCDDNDRGFGNQTGVYLIIILVVVAIVTLLTWLDVIKEPPSVPHKKRHTIGATLPPIPVIKKPL